MRANKGKWEKRKEIEKTENKNTEKGWQEVKRKKGQWEIEFERMWGGKKKKKKEKEEI